MRRKTPPLAAYPSRPRFDIFYRPAVIGLEDRTLLSTITWASDVSGDWDNASMWTGGRCFQGRQMMRSSPSPTLP